MRIEHTAFNVADAREVADWYTTHLGMKIVSAMTEAPYTHFLADEANSMIEIYSNLAAEIPDYKSMHHLIVHLAFVSTDPDSDKKRLMEAGATFVEEINLPDGSQLLMMRDPWGLAIQFCKRGTPLV